MKKVQSSKSLIKAAMLTKTIRRALSSPVDGGDAESEGGSVYSDVSVDSFDSIDSQRTLAGALYDDYL
jgi:hypothetical protein